jgi:hypothetical protein
MLQSHASSVTDYNGLNFAEWNEQVQFHLNAQNLDLALLTDKPDPLTDDSSEDEEAFMAD